MLRAFIHLFVSITILLLLWLPHAGAQTLSQREFTIRDGLVQSQVDRLFLDSRGILWVTTRGGLACFNGQDIKNYIPPNLSAGAKIRAISEDTSGNIIFINQHGVFSFDGKHFNQLPIPDLNYGHLHIDDNNLLWVYNNYPQNDIMSLDVYDLSYECKKIKREKLPDPTLYDYRLQLLRFKYNSTLKLKDYKPVSDEVLFKQFPDLFSQYCEFYLDQSKCGANYRNTFEGREVKELLNFIRTLLPLFAYEHYQEPGRLLYSYDSDLKGFISLDLYSGIQDTLKMGGYKRYIRPYIDSLQRIWGGTEVGFMEIFNDFIIEYDTSATHISWSILDLQGDSILFLPYNRNPLIFDGRNYHAANIDCPVLNDSYYMSIKQLKDGRILLPSGYGLLILESNLKCIDSIQEKLSSRVIQDLAINKDQTMALGATLGGLIVYNLDPDKISKKIIELPEPKLNTTYSSAVSFDSTGNYWLGHEKGLSIYNLSDSSWRHYSNDMDNFPAGDVATIYQDKYKNFWLGSAQGLVYGNLDEGFQIIKDPLFSGVVNAIDSFDKDRIILGGSFGLCILNIEKWTNENKLIGKVFNHSNGFMAGEPGENAIYRMYDGSIMVGTQSYPVRIFPDKINLQVKPLTTQVYKINDSLLTFQAANNTLQIPDNITNIRLDFEAIGMYRPIPTRYSYQLNGGEWSEWQEEAFVEFSDLGSGEHTFALKALTPGIDPSRIPVSQISFSTSVPLYMEPYFPELLSGLLAFSAVLIGFMLFLNYQQRNRNRKNAYAIDYLRIQSLQAQMNPHFVFNVLGTLQNMILRADVQKANEQLVNLSTLIRRFLESTVQGDIKNSHSAIKEQSLDKEIELLELYIQFEQIQYADEFDYNIEVDPSLDAESYSIPPMLIQPFVENAIKHGLLYKSSKGNLKLRFSSDNNHLVCTIEDDGVGRSKSEEIQKQSLRIYKSFGSQLVEERIDLLNKMGYRIEYFIEDRPEGGTRVTLKLGS